jgi:hypothetical protein
MPVLKPTQFIGTITYLGVVRSKEMPVWSDPETEVFAAFAGIESEVHTGLTAPSCSRMTSQFPEGTPVRNTRQFSVLCAQEMAATAAAMGLDSLSPSLLGATMVISGIPDFSHVPPGSRLQADTGATLVVNLNNRPCNFPAKGIEQAHTGYGAAFKRAAEGRRGVVAWVEREGVFRLGDKVRLHIPDQRVWALLEEALAG